MITRVPMNISAGTRDARELLVSLLVESLSLSLEWFGWRLGLVMGS